MRKTIGRFELREYSDGSGFRLTFDHSHNDRPDKCDMLIQIEELHDLRYMIDRQLSEVEARSK